MKIKKIIIILVIILGLLLLLFGGILLMNIKRDLPDEEPTINIPIYTSLKTVKDKNEYFTVKTCVSKYFEYLNKEDENNNYIIDEAQEQYLAEQENIRKEAIYSMLDEEYIKYKGIDQNNIFEKIERRNSSFIQIDYILASERNENVTVYFIFGELEDKKTKETTELKMMIKMDRKNKSFKVILQDYIEEYYKNIREGEEIDIANINDIEKNNYNIYDYEMIDDAEYVLELSKELQRNLMYNPEKTYDYLNDDYKKQKFGTKEEFIEYVKNNYKKFVMMEIKNYQINNYDDYIQYVCIDQNGDYYIFNETGVMKYTVILDTYTIDLPQFIEEYNNSDDSNKVLMNLQKIVDALNDGDYIYIYNKLDNTFKQNNFPTQADFEKYAKENFYTNNEVSYSNYRTSGNLHIYDLSFKDKNNAGAQAVTKNFIMQLGEGTDFVMSFNVE